MSRSLAFALALVPALASAQSLGEAQAIARETLTEARLARAATVAARTQDQKKAPAPRPVTVKCAVKAGGRSWSVSGVLDLTTMALTPEGLSATKPLSAPEGKSFVDSRCGQLGASIAGSYSYEVTPVHKWGQDILQLPKSAFGPDGPRPVTGSVHVCDYDGDWSSSSNYSADCAFTTP